MIVFHVPSYLHFGHVQILKFGDDYIAYRRKVGAFCPWAMPCDFMVVAMQAQAVKLTTTEHDEYQELFG